MVNTRHSLRIKTQSSQSNKTATPNKILKQSNDLVKDGNDRSFRVINVDGDGNCLFRTVSLFLNGDQNGYSILRKEAVDHIRRNWNTLQNFVFVNDEFLKKREEYCKYMSRDKVFGTSLEIMALSEVKKLKFVIFTNYWLNGQILKTPPTIICKENYERTIYLLLLGQVDAERFQLLKIQSNEKEGKHFGKRLLNNRKNQSKRPSMNQNFDISDKI